MKRSTGCASCALIALAGTSLAFAGSGIPESQILLPTGNVGDDSYGWSAAMDGDDIAIGAPLDNVIGANNGSVTVINGSDVQVLSPANTGAFDYFGYSVDISGDVLIAGSTIHPIATREGAPTSTGATPMARGSRPCSSLPTACTRIRRMRGRHRRRHRGRRRWPTPKEPPAPHVFAYGTNWSVQQQLDADQPP